MANHNTVGEVWKVSAIVLGIIIFGLLVYIARLQLVTTDEVSEVPSVLENLENKKIIASLSGAENETSAPFEVTKDAAGELTWAFEYSARGNVSLKVTIVDSEGNVISTLEDGSAGAEPDEGGLGSGASSSTTQLEPGTYLARVESNNETLTWNLYLAY